MARHTEPNSPRGALLRAGLTVTVAVGAALGAVGAAQAVPAAPGVGADGALGDLDTAAAAQAATSALSGATASGLGPAKSLRLNPLAGTGVDPLDNAIATQVADFQPVSTAPVTAPLTQGGALKDLPVVGGVTGLLPG
ncbi:hypothetical protein [Streptomyces sp. NPDC050504]|uniref:hypothetical protein n=1 Tax=Streptomyces sp. NPDC050504 TaxID=3365618 RepID=UPI0037A29750